MQRSARCKAARAQKRTELTCKAWREEELTNVAVTGVLAALGADAANKNVGRVRAVLGTWREKADWLELSRTDIALIEPVVTAG